MKSQVNLLPGLKQDNLKAQRTRRLILGVTVGIIVISLAVPVGLFIIRSGQTIVLNRTQKSIDEKTQTIEDTENIETILTTKDHLQSLPQLYQQRLLISNLFTLLPAATPQEIKLTNLEVNSDGSIAITGVAPSYASVDKFFLGLQRAGTDYNADSVQPNPNTTGQFRNLVLENVGGLSGLEIGFTIKGSFEQSIITGAPNGQE